MDERDIETHPDLMDPDWQKHAEREAWTEVRRSRRRRNLKRMKPRTPRKPGLRTRSWLVGGLVAVALVGIAVVLVQRSANPSPSTSRNALPDRANVDLKAPFANTPADAWRDGVAGFTAPAPVAIGGFSAKEVGDAYERVKQAIAASDLDRRMLEGHDPSAYLALLAPNEAKRTKEVLDGTDPRLASAFVVRVADGFHLLPTGPRLTGKLSARQGDDPGELIVHTAYVVAYAFDAPNPDSLTGPGDHVAFHKVDGNYHLRKGGRYQAADQGLAPGESQGETYSMACGASDKGLLAPVYSETRAYDALPGTDETNVFDPDKPVDGVDTCGGPSTPAAPTR
ncbi:hypothetical protein [Amycolatopsis sp. CA-230715]|uniref:hypothetical protein n=1 Tax=Amycolatopsis sp. CA-230715 TaxID=2745196 RepID=UPI001C01B92A|nr:hypothetical protein [Amycolatopsis sp. CA-230715]QWF83619.1 hypothetical protein HUW46_07062 [Amycolatopsis sp. CA-230715]